MNNDRVLELDLTKCPWRFKRYRVTDGPRRVAIHLIHAFLYPPQTKFLFAWFWGFPEQNKDFAIQNMGERGVSFCEQCSQYF